MLLSEILNIRLTPALDMGTGNNEMMATVDR